MKLGKNPLTHTKRDLSRYKSQAWLADQVQGLYIALTLMVIITSAGTIGYMVVEGWDLSESFYMTVITLSTVGYGEVRPLTEAGRLFSAGLIMVGMCIAAYTFGIIGRTALQGELYKYRQLNRMYKRIAQMKNHTIICGYGRLSRFVVPDLLEHNEEIVVIDNDPKVLETLQAAGISYVEGSAYEDEILIEAGIKRAEALLTLLPNDSDNVFVTLCARDLNSKIHIVARTESVFGERKLRRAGASQIISPYRVSASRAVQQLLHPYVNDFLEIACDDSGNHLVLERVMIPKESVLADKTLEESELRKRTGVTIAACTYPNGEMVLSPSRDTVIKPGTSLIVIGTETAIEKLGDVLDLQE